jgi:hypothetical protein
MPQNEQFEFLLAVAAREQQDEREQPAGDEVDERHEHGQPSRTGAPTLSRLPAIRALTPHGASRQSLCTPRGLDGEEVAGEHAWRLGSDERAPGRMAPLRQPLKTFFKEHFPHRGRRDSDAQTFEFADDASVSLVRVLVAEPQDQSTQRRLERRPTESSVRIRPAASDELTVPTQQRVGLDREARPCHPAAVSDSALRAMSDQPASASAAELADGGSRVHGAAPRFRAPSADAAAPAARRA